jgi:hypothetical protein
VEYQLALPSDKKGCSPAKDFPSPTKPLYGSGSRKNIEAPDLAAVKDFRFYAATSKGKIAKKITCNLLNVVAEWSAV